MAEGRAEALVVAPTADANTLNILGNNYEVVSRYNA